MLEWLANPTDIHDDAGTLVACVEKTLYVRLKPQARQA
jgi:hypothetical protein